MRRQDDPKLDLLRSIELFRDADRKALEHLAAAADEVSLDPGTVVIASGHYHTAGYVVVAGTLGVIVDGEEVAQVGPGEIVGELALLDHGPLASATVVANTEVTALVIPYNRFDQILDDNPHLMRVLATQLAAKLRAMDALYHH